MLPTAAALMVALAAKAADGLLEARMARWRMTRRMAAQTAVTERRWRAARLNLAEWRLLLLPPLALVSSCRRPLAHP
jgi:hypothetical protein